MTPRQREVVDRIHAKMATFNGTRFMSRGRVAARYVQLTGCSQREAADVFGIDRRAVQLATRRQRERGGN